MAGRLIIVVDATGADTVMGVGVVKVTGMGADAETTGLIVIGAGVIVGVETITGIDDFSVGFVVPDGCTGICSLFIILVKQKNV